MIGFRGFVLGEYPREYAMVLVANDHAEPIVNGAEIRAIKLHESDVDESGKRGIGANSRKSTYREVCDANPNLISMKRVNKNGDFTRDWEGMPAARKEPIYVR